MASLGPDLARKLFELLIIEKVFALGRVTFSIYRKVLLLGIWLGTHD